MKLKNSYRVIGAMSGTSLDGLDLACCRFTLRNKKWSFEIEDALTLPYPDKWKKFLSKAHKLAGGELKNLDASYGQLIGYACASFVEQMKITDVDFISSHGHTVFHQPEKGFTCQIGDGNSIFAETGLPVVYDFRSLDVALGGEGAPLVPAGDLHLFGEYDVCINLGGIANLSFGKKTDRVAFDICFVNMGLNYLAEKSGQAFDENGALASAGTVNRKLFSAISKIYAPMRKARPSLAREGFEKWMKPLLDDDSIKLEDRLFTLCASIADEIHRSLPPSKRKLKLLVTGGGALNPVLMEAINSKSTNAVVQVPSKEIIEFKEALVFAFLGVLRVRGEVNVLKRVTRASTDSCSGVVVGM